LCKAFESAPAPYLEQYKAEASKNPSGPAVVSPDPAGSAAAAAAAATAKQHRSRKLAYSTVGTPDYIGQLHKAKRREKAKLRGWRREIGSRLVSLLSFLFCFLFSP
jgi:hypothetical protein